MLNSTVQESVDEFASLYESIQEAISSSHYWGLLHANISNFYDKKPSLKQTTIFESGITPYLSKLSPTIIKNWRKAERYNICSFLINISYQAYNIPVSKYLNKDFFKLIIDDLEQNTLTTDNRLIRILLLANIAFNIYLNNDTSTKELLTTNDTNLLNLLCKHLSKTENDFGECELALCAPTIAFIDNEEHENTLWLFDTYPKLFDSLLNEWDCALNRNVVVYEEWTYIPGCWMRAVFVDHLMSVSANYCDVFVDKNVLQFVARSLKFNCDEIQSSVLLHSHSCGILSKMSLVEKYHQRFLQLQFDEEYELWKTMNALIKEINLKEYGLDDEITCVDHGYEIAVNHCRECIRYIREYYIQPLLKVNISSLGKRNIYGDVQCLHITIIHEIVNFIWY